MMNNNSFCFGAMSIMLDKRFKLTHLVILFLIFCAVFSYPSQPLNERSQEISWQAWLLVDDQNQNNNKQQATVGDDGLLRRRITAKSVFIAPTFSPDDLPACAEGYTSDSMNRCVPIFKLDEAQQLNFLLNQLNDKFGPGGLDIEEEEDEEIEVDEVISTVSKPSNTNPGPLQFNIPLITTRTDDDVNNSKDNEELEPGMTIIITPTANKGNSGIKLDKREDDLVAEEELRKLLKRTSSTSTTTVKMIDEFVTSSTIKDYDATEDDLVSTTENVIDVTDAVDYETTTNFEEELETTTENSSDNPDDTTDEFFSSTTANIPTTEYEEKVTTIAPPKITTYHPKVNFHEPLTTTTPKFLIRFPEDDDIIDSAVQPKTQSDFVRFPTTELQAEFPLKLRAKENVHQHTRDTQRQEDFLPRNDPGVKFTSSGIDRILFPQDQPMSDQGDEDQAVAESEMTVNFEKNTKKSELVSSSSSISSSSTTQRIPSTRKSREKNILTPSRWDTNTNVDGIQKRPLILRLRKPVLVDSDKLKNMKFYRSVPAEHLSYLFGFNNHSSHR